MNNKLKTKIMKMLAGNQGSMMSIFLGKTKMKKYKKKKKQTLSDLPIKVRPQDIIFMD